MNHGYSDRSDRRQHKEKEREDHDKQVQRNDYFGNQPAEEEEAHSGLDPEGSHRNESEADSNHEEVVREVYDSHGEDSRNEHREHHESHEEGEEASSLVRCGQSTEVRCDEKMY